MTALIQEINMPAQTRNLLALLRRGKVRTTDQHGCAALSARIWDLKNVYGFNIKTLRGVITAYELV